MEIVIVVLFDFCVIIAIIFIALWIHQIGQKVKSLEAGFTSELIELPNLTRRHEVRLNSLEARMHAYFELPKRDTNGELDSLKEKVEELEESLDTTYEMIADVHKYLGVVYSAGEPQKLVKTKPQRKGKEG